MRTLGIIFILLLAAPVLSGDLDGTVKIGALNLKIYDTDLQIDRCLYLALHEKYTVDLDGIRASVFGGFDSYGIANGGHGQRPFRIIYSIGLSIGWRSLELRWSHFCSHPVDSGFDDSFATANSIFGEHDEFVMVLKL